MAQVCPFLTHPGQRLNSAWSQFTNVFVGAAPRRRTLSAGGTRLGDVSCLQAAPAGHCPARAGHLLPPSGPAAACGRRRGSCAEAQRPCFCPGCPGVGAAAAAGPLLPGRLPGALPGQRTQRHPEPLILRVACHCRARVGPTCVPLSLLVTPLAPEAGTEPDSCLLKKINVSCCLYF